MKAGAASILGMSAILTVLGFSSPASAQMVRYECMNTEITSGPVTNFSDSWVRKESRNLWEDKARQRFGFRYKWRMAQEVPSKTGTYDHQVKSGDLAGKTLAVGVATAYPCRVLMTLPRGYVETTGSQANKCEGYPSFSVARTHGCQKFYPLRR